MSVLEHLAQAAAVILLIELMIVVLVFLAISGGLAFGFRWVNGKTGPAFSQVNHWMEIGRTYVHRGTDYLALPFILAGRYAGTAGGAVGAIQTRVRRNQARREGLEMANEAAKPPSVEGEPLLPV